MASAIKMDDLMSKGENVWRLTSRHEKADAGRMSSRPSSPAIEVQPGPGVKMDALFAPPKKKEEDKTKPASSSSPLPTKAAEKDPAILAFSAAAKPELKLIENVPLPPPPPPPPPPEQNVTEAADAGETMEKRRPSSLKDKLDQINVLMRVKKNLMKLLTDKEDMHKLTEKMGEWMSENLNKTVDLFEKKTVDGCLDQKAFVSTMIDLKAPFRFVELYALLIHLSTQDPGHISIGDMKQCIKPKEDPDFCNICGRGKPRKTSFPDSSAIEQDEVLQKIVRNYEKKDLNENQGSSSSSGEKGNPLISMVLQSISKKSSAILESTAPGKLSRFKSAYASITEKQESPKAAFKRQNSRVSKRLSTGVTLQKRSSKLDDQSSGAGKPGNKNMLFKSLMSRTIMKSVGEVDKATPPTPSRKISTRKNSPGLQTRTSQAEIQKRASNNKFNMKKTPELKSWGSKSLMLSKNKSQVIKEDSSGPGPQGLLGNVVSKMAVDGKKNQTPEIIVEETKPSFSFEKPFDFQKSLSQIGSRTPAGEHNLSRVSSRENLPAVETPEHLRGGPANKGDYLDHQAIQKLEREDKLDTISYLIPVLRERFILAHLRFVVYDHIVNSPSHFTLLLNCKDTVAYLVNRIKEYNDVVCSFVYISPNRHRLQQSQLTHESSLKLCGYRGYCKNHPQKITLYYDYQMPDNPSFIGIID